jgi:hypothetical protein
MIAAKLANMNVGVIGQANQIQISIRQICLMEMSAKPKPPSCSMSQKEPLIMPKKSNKTLSMIRVKVWYQKA